MSQQPRRDPTEAEIAIACAEIQRGWTASEHIKRMRPDLRPTFSLCDGERETMSGEAYERHLAGAIGDDSHEWEGADLL